MDLGLADRSCMKVQYIFKHLDHSDALQDYTQTLLDSCSRFLLKDTKAHVTFSKRQKEFCVEVTVFTKQRAFRSKSFHFDVYASVDESVQKLEKQFLKVRKINTHHKKPEVRRNKRWPRKTEAA